MNIFSYNIQNAEWKACGQDRTVTVRFKEKILQFYAAADAVFLDTDKNQNVSFETFTVESPICFCSLATEGDALKALSFRRKTVDDYIDSLILSGLTAVKDGKQYISFERVKNGEQFIDVEYRLPTECDAELASRLISFEKLIPKGNLWVLHPNEDGSVYFTRRPHNTEEAEALGGKGIRYCQQKDYGPLEKKEGKARFGEYAIAPDARFAFYKGPRKTEGGYVKTWRYQDISAVPDGVYSKASFRSIVYAQDGENRTIHFALGFPHDLDGAHNFPRNYLIVKELTDKGAVAAFPDGSEKEIVAEADRTLAANTLWRYREDGLRYVLTPVDAKEGPGRKLLYHGVSRIIVEGGAGEMNLIRAVTVKEKNGILSFEALLPTDMIRDTYIWAAAEPDGFSPFVYALIQHPEVQRKQPYSDEYTKSITY